MSSHDPGTPPASACPETKVPKNHLWRVLKPRLDCGAGWARCTCGHQKPRVRRDVQVHSALAQNRCLRAGSVLGASAASADWPLCDGPWCPALSMATLGVDGKEVWFLILQHLHKSPFGCVARQLEQLLTDKSLLPAPASAPGATLRPSSLRIMWFCAVAACR